MAQKKGNNGPTIRGQLELVLCDVDDGAAELAAIIHLAEKIKRRASKAYTHNARGYRRIVIVNDGPLPDGRYLPEDADEYPRPYTGPERRRQTRSREPVAA